MTLQQTIQDRLAIQADGLPLRRHVLDLDDYSREELESTLASAHGMAEVLGRDIKKVPALRGKVIVTMFYEASTRTRISFEEAGKVLSADVINMSASGSSTDKGESLLNTGLTLQAMGVDTLVVRHPHSGAPNFLARNLDRVSIVNAGDGLHAHPTQALLDLYTVQSRLGCIEGLKIVIVGDVLHSRVARSCIWGFARMGARVVLSGPRTLMPLDFLDSDGHGSHSIGLAPQVEVDTNLDRAVEDADVVMAPPPAVGTPTGRFPSEHPGVYTALAGQRRAPGAGKVPRAGHAPRPHERGHRNQFRPGSR